MLKPLKGQKLKDHIYDTAIELFCNQGYEETTLIDITQEANVSTRTLHKYYPTKDAILRQFTSENLMATMEYSQNLPESMPLKKKICKVMLFDYEQMFCLFDISTVLSVAAEREHRRDSFELRNFEIAETIYYCLVAAEQEKRGLQPGLNTQMIAATIFAEYRHTCDSYRFSHFGRFDQELFQKIISSKLDIIWPGVEHAMKTQVEDPDGELSAIFDHVPVSKYFLEQYRSAKPFIWDHKLSIVA